MVFWLGNAGRGRVVIGCTDQAWEYDRHALLVTQNELIREFIGQQVQHASKASPPGLLVNDEKVSMKTVHEKGIS